MISMLFNPLPLFHHPPPTSKLRSSNKFGKLYLQIIFMPCSLSFLFSLLLLRLQLLNLDRWIDSLIGPWGSYCFPSLFLSGFIDWISLFCLWVYRLSYVLSILLLSPFRRLFYISDFNFSFSLTLVIYRSTWH